MKTTILVLEDHSLLRRSMARVLSELPDVEVVALGTLEEALAAVRQRQPELVVADLELPDGSGIDLLHALSGASVPFIFVSGYVPEYLDRLSQHPAVVVREKPMPMHELQTLALAQIEAFRMTAVSPFSAADYIQLSCMGRHTVVIDVERRGVSPLSGRIFIVRGEIWAAQAGERVGLDAFYALALAEGCEVRCTGAGTPTIVRNIESDSWEQLLLEAARRHDESTR